MYPFSNHPTSILNNLIIKLNFHLSMPIFHPTTSLKTRHENIPSIYAYFLRTILPRNPQWFHIQPKPQHLFLECSIPHIFCLLWLYLRWREIKSWLDGPVELCLRRIDWLKNVYWILGKLFHLGTVNGVIEWGWRDDGWWVQDHLFPLIYLLFCVGLLPLWSLF